MDIKNTKFWKSPTEGGVLEESTKAKYKQGEVKRQTLSKMKTAFTAPLAIGVKPKSHVAATRPRRSYACAPAPRPKTTPLVTPPPESGSGRLKLAAITIGAIACCTPQVSAPLSHLGTQLLVVVAQAQMPPAGL